MTETIPLRRAKAELVNGVATLSLLNAEVKVNPKSKDIQVKSNDGFQLLAAYGSVQIAPGRAKLMDDKTADLNGVTVQQATDGHLIITAPSGAEAEAIFPAERFEVGQLTKEGVFFGYSTDKDGTKRAWFADLADARDAEGKRLNVDFNEAAAVIGKLNHENHLGHSDWTAPPTWSGQKAAFDALQALFNNRAAIEGFDDSAKYWSSSPVYTTDSEYKQFVDFKEGHRNSADEKTKMHLRAVRSVAL